MVAKLKGLTQEFTPYTFMKNQIVLQQSWWGSLNPTFKKHGKLGEGEAHKGDINFTADSKGNGSITFTTRMGN
jgi:Cu-Zn family superoxide dismutase